LSLRATAGKSHKYDAVKRARLRSRIVLFFTDQVLSLRDPVAMVPSANQITVLRRRLIAG
jgi:hypothetical protein